MARDCPGVPTTKQTLLAAVPSFSFHFFNEMKLRLTVGSRARTAEDYPVRQFSKVNNKTLIIERGRKKTRKMKHNNAPEQREKFLCFSQKIAIGKNGSISVTASSRRRRTRSLSTKTGQLLFFKCVYVVVVFFPCAHTAAKLCSLSLQRNPTFI